MLKKITAVLLSLLMLVCFAAVALAAEPEEQVRLSSFGAYDHVFIIGVDGAGQFFNATDTPNFDAIFKNNAVTYNALGEYVTVSAENWGSILCGVAYDVHGFTNGSIDENERDSTSPCPSIFRLVREVDENAVLASFCHWSPINHGAIENDLNVYKYNASSDPLVANAVCDYLNKGNAPKLMFVQLDSVDSAGHSSNCYDDHFYEAIQTADSQIGDIYRAAYHNGLMENGLFIVVTDHGHSPEGGHGGRTPEEYTVTVAVAGKTVADNSELTNVKNRDVASIALYALGIEQPAEFTSTVPDGLWEYGEHDVNEPPEEKLFVKGWKALRDFVLKLVNLLVNLFQ